MVGTTGSTYWAEHGRETSAPQNSLLSRVVSSPPTRHSDLPLTLPWQPVLGTSPGRGLPATYKVLLLKGTSPHLLLFLLLLKNRSRKYTHCSLMAEEAESYGEGTGDRQAGPQQECSAGKAGVPSWSTGNKGELGVEDRRKPVPRGAGTPAQGYYPHEFLDCTLLHLGAHLSSGPP